MTSRSVALASIIFMCAGAACNGDSTGGDHDAAATDASANVGDAAQNADAVPTNPDAGGALCCDVAKQPGFGDNPVCFEGASCCDDGTWQCNNGAGQPTCSGSTGDVCTADACCDPADQPGVGDNPTCIEGASCCNDGSWQCNSGAGQPTCSDTTGDVCAATD